MGQMVTFKDPAAVEVAHRIRCAWSRSTVPSSEERTDNPTTQKARTRATQLHAQIQHCRDPECHWHTQKDKTAHTKGMKADTLMNSDEETKELVRDVRIGHELAPREERSV